MKRTFFIAGVQYRPRNEINEAAKMMNEIREMMGGLQLSLEAEPTNKFDPNAIKIIYDVEASDRKIFLGFVPKKYSSEVAGMLSIGAPVECTVDAVDPLAKTYEMFKVTVQIPVDEEEGLEPYDEDSELEAEGQ